MLCRLLIFALFLPVISHTQTYSSSEVLDEFVLIEKLPIKITADTISYTVDSFLRYPNATTEDALKHLSGALRIEAIAATAALDDHRFLPVQLFSGNDTR